MRHQAPPPEAPRSTQRTENMATRGRSILCLPLEARPAAVAVEHAGSLQPHYPSIFLTTRGVFCIAARSIGVVKRRKATSETLYLCLSKSESYQRSAISSAQAVSIQNLERCRWQLQLRSVLPARCDGKGTLFFLLFFCFCFCYLSVYLS